MTLVLRAVSNRPPECHLLLLKSLQLPLGCEECLAEETLQQLEEPVSDWAFGVPARCTYFGLQSEKLSPSLGLGL